MPEDAVLVHRHDGVATLVLNRPERLNAINNSVIEGLMNALESVERDREIRVAVITGAGRGFCAGGDIEQMKALKTGFHSAAFRGFLEAGHVLIRKLRTIPKPVVASVNGPAAGGGVSLALACDLRIASERATFTQAFFNLGLHPDWGGTFTLPRLAGMGRALEMFWLSEPLGAEEAKRLGMINFLVPPESLAGETTQLAARLAAAAPLPMALMKQAFYERIHTEIERVMDHELEAQMKCFASEDFSEGLRAFSEKRVPKFKGS